LFGSKAGGVELNSSLRAVLPEDASSPIR
jgi:hypothetical protein